MRSRARDIRIPGEEIASSNTVWREVYEIKDAANAGKWPFDKGLMALIRARFFPGFGAITHTARASGHSVPPE